MTPTLKSAGFTTCQTPGLTPMFTIAKLWDPVYSQVLDQNKVDRLRESDRRHVIRDWRRRSRLIWHRRTILYHC